MSTKVDQDVVRTRIEDLKKHHQATFNKIGYDTYYRPHLCFKPKGKDTKHVSFFASELKAGKDIYTEFTNKEYISEDPSRTLYKWPYNPSWQEAYDRVTNPDGTSERYLIPVSELVVIPHVDNSKEITLELNNPDIDMPIDQITIRDLAAVLLNKPVSMKPWLNDIITKSK